MQIVGLLLNMSHYTCTSCSTLHELFGSSASFEKAADELGLGVLGKHLSVEEGRDKGLIGCQGRLPLVTSVSDGGDAGRPIMVQSSVEGEEVREVMRMVGRSVWDWLIRKPGADVGTRG